MTNEQIIEVCDKYCSLLHDIEPVRENDKPNSMRHIKWMCIEIPNMIGLNKIEKANRWLGFVQGVLWSNEIYDIHQLKSDNR